MKSSLMEELREIFVTKDIFNLRINPLEKIVYGAVGLVCVSVFTAIIYLVVKR